MNGPSESKKLRAAFRRLQIYVLIWSVAFFLVLMQHFNDLSEFTRADVLRLFSLLFLFHSFEGIYFKYYWSLKMWGRRPRLFIPPALDKVVVWQSRSAFIFGILYAFLAVILYALSFR